jgi:molecular chaperone GrpE (heat shock protein)
MTDIKTVTNTAFGKTLHYVLDDNQADAIRQLTGKKTINDNDIIALMQLGFRVNDRSLQDLIAV